MTALQVGDTIPAGVHFTYVPPSGDLDITSCGTPQPFDFSDDCKGKKVVLVAVPGAFTPTCQVSHLPSFLKQREALRAKGVGRVVVIAFNDAWVMSAWAKANGVKDDFFIFASDEGAKFSKSIGWTLGERTGRYAIALDKGKVVYASEEKNPKEVDSSGADAVLAHL